MLRSDWEAVYIRWLAEKRHGRRELPTVEDLLAYSRGELPSGKASEVRELLVCFPDLARALAAPLDVPNEAKPGELDYLSEEDFEQDWETIERRLTKEATSGDDASAAQLRPAPEIAALQRQLTAVSARPGRRSKVKKGDPPALDAGSGRRTHDWGLAALAAALVAVVLSGLYFNAEREAKRLAIELKKPQANLEEHELLPDGSPRGTGRQEPITFSPPERFVMRPALVKRPPYPDYRVTLVRVRGTQEKELWSARGLERRSDDTFKILLHRDFLGPGIYRLRIYGIGQGREDLLATYTIELLGS